MTAVYLRELRSYFITPIGYIYAAMFLAVSGLLFGYTTLLPDASTTTGSSQLALYFLFMMGVFCILIPLLTMKLFSDDRRLKTEQLLLTAPLSLFGMVMGLLENVSTGGTVTHDPQFAVTEPTPTPRVFTDQDYDDVQGVLEG